MFKPSIEETTIFESRIKLTKDQETSLKVNLPYDSYLRDIGVINGYHIKLLFSYDEDLPILPVPYPIETTKKQYIVVDIRPFVAKISNTNRFENTQDYKVTNILELNQQVMSAILMASWESGSKDITYNTLFAMEAMGKLIGGTIATRLGLDVVTATQIEVYSDALYLSNSLRDKKLLKDTIFLAGKIAKTTHAQPQRIIDYLSDGDKSIIETGKLTNVNDLAKLIKEMDNPRLANFELTTLLNLLGNISSFFSYDVRIMAALEYPPIWIPLVYGAIDDKRHKKSYLSTRINTVKTRNRNFDVFEDYLKNIFALVDYDNRTGK